jgi:hypothetical protein
MLKVAGCAYVEYGDAKYVRVMNQKVQNVEITLKDGTTIKIGEQEANNDEIIKLVSSIIELKLAGITIPGDGNE